MPELPEVETVVRILNTFVPNKTIKDVVVYREKSIPMPVSDFKNALIGETFLPTTRKGKHIIFHLTNNKVIVSHLRMEGKYFESSVDATPDKHDILCYQFTDGTALRFNDVRKFGTTDLRTEDNYKTTLPLSKVGKEPWEISAKDLREAFKKKNGTIKESLLDQTIMCGLGNIYVDEVLFATNIHPKTPANTVSIKDLERIIGESRRILEDAIECGGSTIRSYHPKEGMDGRMQNQLLAYGHANEPCPKCGMIMRKIEVGGRGTTYCPKCQQRKGYPFIVGVTGRIGAGKSSVTNYLKDKGYKVLDADKIVHELYKTPAVVNELTHAFGRKIAENGVIKHDVLLSLVSDNKEKKETLERIVHFHVYKEMFDVIRSNKYKKIVLDVPLLLNGPLENECDLIIYVDTPEKIRMERIAKRGKDVKKAIALNKGWPSARAKAVAGIIIDGSGSLDDLKAQLDQQSRKL